MKNSRDDLSDFPDKKKSKMYRLNRKIARRNATQTMSARTRLRADISVAI